MSENPDQVTYFAQTNSRGSAVPFGIRSEDRGRHMYIIGKTGMGKSTLLENMAIQDIRNGEGMAFLDPHGSTAEHILEYVPAHRMRDVVYFAPFDIDHPVAFNVMEDVGYDKRHLVVSGLMSAFQKIWEDAWSARMEYILSNTLLALLEYEGATLLDVNRMLVGAFKKNGDTVKDTNAFRYKVVQNIKDPMVKKFWMDEFYGYSERYIQEATPAIQNKVGQFTSNPLIRNIIGQPKSSFDIRRMMDEKKIIIMNLSKGRVGEVNTNLLGSMLVTKIYLAAMSRADVPVETMRNLPPFYLYVDEFQNFANKSFSDILSEARKYKLRLVIAHQYVEQMEEEVRDAVFGNVGTTVAFRVGPFDAETLEPIFAPQFQPTDLVNLGFAQIYLTLMIKGVGSPPFSATTLPPFDPPPERYIDSVLAYSRAQFGRPRSEVEALVAKWQASEDVVPTPPQKPFLPAEAPMHDERPMSHKPPPLPGVKKVFSSASVVVRPAAAHRVVDDMPPPEVMQEKILPPVPPAQAYTRPHSSASTARPHAQKTSSSHAPQKPPLEGTNSLKEALAQIKVGASAAPTVPVQKPAPAPMATPMSDLKSALARIAPPRTTHVPPPTTQKETPDTINKKMLEDMLAVEEPPNEA